MANKYGNNARALYQDIADSIRTVGKTTEEIHAYDFPEAIQNIKTCELTLTVTALPGALITAVSEAGISVSATVGDNGVAIMQLPEQGAYNVSAELDGITAISRTVTATGEYETEMLFPDAVLENNSWEMISKVSQAGYASSIWSVGDTKSVPLSGTYLGTNFDCTVDAVVLGINHNANVEGNNLMHFGVGKIGKNLVAFCGLRYGEYGIGDPFGSANTNANSGHGGYTNAYYTGWGQSLIRFHLGASFKPNFVQDETFISLLPDELRNILRPAIKEANGVFYVEYATCLAPSEVVDSSYYATDATEQYAYFANGNSRTIYRHDATVTSAEVWTRQKVSDTDYLYDTKVYRLSLGSVAGVYKDYSFGIFPIIFV